MNIRIPRLLGEIHDKDTQFSAAMKQNQEIVLIGGVIAVILLGVFGYSFVPQTREGTWRYAICKIFLERYSQYPTELNFLTVAEKQNSAQIGYLTTNSYGSQESELIECFYNTDQRGVTINRITINRKPLVFNFSKDVSNNTQNNRGSLDQKEIMGLLEKGRQDMADAKYTQLRLDEFNKTIGTIMSRDDLDLTIPGFLPKSIADLKFTQ